VKRLSLCLLILVFLFGCASTSVQVHEDNNTFVSTYPKLTIKMSPEYKYIGEYKYGSSGSSLDAAMSTTRREKVYFFVKSSPNNTRIDRAISIWFMQTSTYWNPASTLIPKNKKTSGTCELVDKDYKYYTRFINVSAGRKHTKFVTDKGYVLPNFMFEKSHLRVVGAKNNILVKINYYEDATTGTKSKARFQRFNDHCTEAFEVLDSL